MPEEPAISFAGFRLEPDGSLFSGSTLIHLPPRELMALRLLLASAGQVVTPVQLKRALWGDVHVTADSVPRCLSSLRARLQPADCIQTVYKRGYRLLANVQQHYGSHAQALPRLAIPPFATDTGVPEHLGTGVAEETIARLSNAPRPAASILARDSVFTLSDAGYTALRIGETLRADLVLAGTLRALPSHFRLRVEMIRVADGIQIWVEDLLAAKNEVSSLESELAARLCFRLQPSMPDSGKSKYQAPQPPVALDREEHESPHPALAGQDARTLAAPSQHWSDLAPNGSTSGSMSIAASAAPRDKAVDDARRREAYESFLRGRHEWQTLERHRMQDALQFLARALELDPFLVAARVDLARLSVTQAACGFVPASVAAATVHRTAGSLPEFAGQSESLLPLLGTICFHVDHDLPAAIAAFSRSAHLPYDTWNMRERAMFALSRRRFPEGIALLEEAIHQDPFSPWLHARLAWAFHLAGEPARSVQQIHRGLSTFPNHECMALYGAMILPFNGDAASGVRLAESLTARRPYFDLGAALHAYALACAGRRQQALAIVERLQWLSRQRFVSSSFNPAVHVALGDHDAAIADLCTAEHARCPWFFQMLADPRLAPLHGHPEFERLQAILPRMEAALAV